MINVASSVPVDSWGCWCSRKVIIVVVVVVDDDDDDDDDDDRWPLP